MNSRKITLILLFLILSAVLLSGCSPKEEPKEPTIAEKYEEAIGLLQAGRLSDAAAAFEDLGHYMDASKYALYCRALGSAGQEKWQEAAATFDTLGDFMDSRILTAYCRGRSLEAEELYEDAVKAYDGLTQYADVSLRLSAMPEKILAREYRKADSLERNGDLHRALSAFKALGSYSDSPARAEKVQEKLDQIDLAEREEKYRDALAMETAGDIRGAYDAFTALGSFQDSAERAAALKPEADYLTAFDLAESGDYLQAQRLYASLEGYKDAPERSRLLLAFQKADDAGRGRLAAGVYRYRLDGKYGFIDLNNAHDLAPRWSSLDMFYSNGLAIAAYGKDHLLIDLNGRQVTDAYSSLYRLNGNCYAAGRTVRYTTVYSILNAEGKTLSDGWSDVERFSGGMAAVRRGSDSLWGYIDETGSVAIQPAYRSAGAFSEGMAPVETGDGWQYIAPDNSLLIGCGPDIEAAESFSDGLALVRSRLYGWQVIDKDGSLVLFKENIYQAAGQLADNGSYENAITLFESLNGYADSDDQAASAREKINRQIYARAEEYEAGGQLELAAETFDWLGDYGDAAERAEAARETIRANTYDQALKTAESGAFEDAIAIFEGLGEYRDSAEQIALLHDRIDQNIRDRAEELFAAGQKTQAIDTLLPIAEKHDNGDRITQMYESYLTDHITRAEALEAEEKYEEAIELYEQLRSIKENAAAYFEAMKSDPGRRGEYTRLSFLADRLAGVTVGNDTAERIAEAEEKKNLRDLNAAERMMADQDFEGAAAILDALGDWGEAAQKAKAAREALEDHRARYAQAEKLENELDFKGAQAAFEALGNYADAKERAETAKLTLEEYQARYSEAEALESQEKYEEAHAAYLALGTFGDAAERAEKTRAQAKEQADRRAYTEAGALEQAGRYEEAIAAFKAIEWYEDSADRIPLIKEKIRQRDLDAARAAIEEDRFDDALRLLGTLERNEEIDGLIAEALKGSQYKAAVAQALAGDINAATKAFTALGDYRDSSVKAGILTNLMRAGKTYNIAPGVLVYEFHDLWGLANLNTNVSVPAKYTSISFEENTQYRALDLMRVFVMGSSEDKNAYGYMNMNGEEVVPCRYWALSDFDTSDRCTVATANIVKKGSGYSAYYYSRLYFGIMDKYGNTITSPQWRTMGSSGNEGWSGSSWDSSKYSETFYMYNSYYTLSLPAFTENRMKVQDRNNGLWGCIDEHGSVMGDGVKWNNIGDFSDGMAMVMLDGKYGFIDTDGRQVGEVRWDSVNAFSSGYAAVRENGFWGFIDHTNTLVIPCRYTEVNEFKDSGSGTLTCDVKKADGTWDVIDVSGESVLYGN